MNFRKFVLGCAAGLLFLGVTPTASAQEFRGLWVDAWGAGFRNSSEVTQLINHCRTYNYNAVIVQLRRRGDAFYMPGITTNDPRTTAVASNFDALQELINQARTGSPRIEVHCWVTTQLIWSEQDKPPPQPGHVFNKHPEFLTKNSSGASYIGEGYYIDPGHPGATMWNYVMATNIVTRYDMDGFHWDYIRYPAQDSGYNDTAIARFNAEFGRTGQPDPNNSTFLTWRRRQVTDFLRWTNADLLAIRPEVIISASVFSSETDAFNHRMQDWVAWNNEGLLDICMPMTYTENNSTYNSRVNNILSKQGVRRSYIGQGAYLNTKENTLTQLLYARNQGALGTVFYSYRVPSSTDSSTATFSHIRNNFQPTWQTPPALPWKANPTKGIFRGTVLRGNNGEPVYNATITIPLASRTLKTDPHGKFAFFELSPGSYGVTVSASGLPPSSGVITVQAGGNDHLEILMPGKPVILAEPQDQIAVLGGSATFSVRAFGTASLQYQWRHNGTNIANATQATYTRSNLAAAHAGDYSVRVSNGAGEAFSEAAVLTVVEDNVPPTILTPPQSQTVIAGSTATLFVEAQGTPPLRYQWRRGTTVLSGATNAALTLNNVQPGDAGDYRVIVSNDFGNIPSDIAALQVHYQLATEGIGGIIGKTPNASSYAPGTTVQLTATAHPGYNFTGWSGSASGTSNPINVLMNGNKTVTANFGVTDIIIDNLDSASVNIVGSWSVGSFGTPWGSNYHWKGPGTGSAHVQFTPNLPASGRYRVYTWYVPGANRTTSAPYVIAHSGGTQTITVNQQQNGQQWYLLGTFQFNAGTSGYVRVTDGYTSGAAVMADAIRFEAVPPPYIIDHPQDQSVAVGQNATFSVSAHGTGLNYQWRFNNGTISGATRSNYTRSNVQPAHQGNYSVRVWNADGEVFSSNAALTVLLPPTITAQPQSQTVNQGDTANFSISASGTEPFGYQWMFEGEPIENGTSNPLALSNVQPDNAGSYSVTVTNAYGSAASGSATLAVRVPPEIVAHPDDQTVAPGDSVTFTVEAIGTAPLTYEWRHDDSPISDATGASYTIDEVTESDAGVYTVSVSNAAGSTLSAPAVLTLVQPELRIEGITLLEGGGIRFELTGPPGRYVVESTEDLTDWTHVDFAEIPEDAEVVDSAPNGTQRFYRARPAPPE